MFFVFEVSKNRRVARRLRNAARLHVVLEVDAGLPPHPTHARLAPKGTRRPRTAEHHRSRAQSDDLGEEELEQPMRHSIGGYATRLGRFFRRVCFLIRAWQHKSRRRFHNGLCRIYPKASQKFVRKEYRNWKVISSNCKLGIVVRPQLNCPARLCHLVETLSPLSLRVHRRIVSQVPLDGLRHVADLGDGVLKHRLAHSEPSSPIMNFIRLFQADAATVGLVALLWIVWHGGCAL